jgi:hypothetical protein
MQFAIMLSLIVLVTISGTARSADSPSGQEPSKPASNHVDNTKSDVKAVGIRDHLQLQPVTSEQFKLAGKANKKSSPRVREHLNLQPLTSDDFKSGKRKSSAPTGSAK